MATRELTHDYLLSILDYDPKTGVFVWKEKRTNIRAGDEAGSISNGYWLIKIDRVKYRAGRLAWFYVYGKWPTGTIDHIDRNKLNDSLLNLRDSNSPQQNQNKGKRKYRKDVECASAYKGVSVSRRTKKKWRAQINLGDGPVHLGYFQTEEEAYAAYCKAAKEHFGEFACLG